MLLMKFTETELNGVILIEPKVFCDNRGDFFESYNEKVFAENGIINRFVQDNQSLSSYGVIRGLHCQTGQHAQSKLVRVLQGRVLDVVVDIRKNSQNFGKYIAIELSDKNRLQLFIPKGFLHGFSVLSETAVFLYKVDNFYNKESERCIRYDDHSVGVNWRIPEDNVIVSEKDLLGQRLEDVADNWF